MTESQEKQAWISSLRLLTATPKTRKELKKKLLEKGYPEAVAEKTLDGLEKQGFLSDKAYAKNLVARLTHEKPSGRRKISFEMKRRGVPAKIQEEVLSGITNQEETERAKELATYKWEQAARLEPLKRKKKVFDFLLRRGFDFQIVRDVIEELDTSNED